MATSLQYHSCRFKSAIAWCHWQIERIVVGCHWLLVSQCPLESVKICGPVHRRAAPVYAGSHVQSSLAIPIRKSTGWQAASGTYMGFVPDARGTGRPLESAARTRGRQEAPLSGVKIGVRRMARELDR